mmetsp:Transcript_12412/g.40905  ORF Transcript_12412/g.40905 Transcript_12412/m.40905 type:complete len:253 (-) Transcript_12412:738-1496(-)
MVRVSAAARLFVGAVEDEGREEEVGLEEVAEHGGDEPRGEEGHQPNPKGCEGNSLEEKVAAVVRVVLLFGAVLERHFEPVVLDGIVPDVSDVDVVVEVKLRRKEEEPEVERVGVDRSRAPFRHSEVEPFAERPPVLVPLALVRSVGVGDERDDARGGERAERVGQEALHGAVPRRVAVVRRVERLVEHEQVLEVLLAPLAHPHQRQRGEHAQGGEPACESAPRHGHERPVLRAPAPRHEEPHHRKRALSAVR